MLTKSTKLKYKLEQTQSDLIRALFLENENLPDQSLRHFNRPWSNLSSLFLGFNHFTCLNGLEVCAFPHLLELCLKGNPIQSVDILCQVSMPNLKKFSLKNNRICTVRSIRKLNIPNIEHISVQKNLIKEFDRFCELECPNLKVLELEFSNNKVLSEDLRWLFKIGFPQVQSNETAYPQGSTYMNQQSISKIDQLFCKSYQRINQPHLIKLLKLKFVSAADSINL